MNTKTEAIFKKIVNLAIRRAPWVALFSLVLLAGAIFVIATKADIRSDLKYLMPQDTRSVRDTFKISDRIGSVSTLEILIEAKDLKLNDEKKQSESYATCRKEMTRKGRELMGDPVVVDDSDRTGDESWCDNAVVFFAYDLQNELKKLDSVGAILFRNDKQFFEKNIFLYASEDELARIYDRVDQNLIEAKKRTGEYKACLITSDQKSECEALKPSMASILQKDGKTSREITSEQAPPNTQINDNSDGSLSIFRDELLENYQKSELAFMQEFPFYPLPDGSYLFRLKVRFKDPSTSLKKIRKHVEGIDEIIAQLDPKSYQASIIQTYGGGIQDQKNEYSAIVFDIARSIGITIFSIFFLIALFFRRIRVAFLIMLPLVTSTLWTIAIVFLTIGYLNIIAAFIFAILLGLGIDYGIHLMSRLDYERNRGLSGDDAIRVAVSETGASIFFGAMTTSATFFTLLLTDFQGFSQFGLVAGIGVIIAFITMVTVFPALASLTFKHTQLSAAKPLRLGKLKGLSPKVGKGLIYVALLIGLAITVTASLDIPNVQFEDDFYNLRMRKTTFDANNDRYYVTKKRHSSPVYVLFDNLNEVHALELMLDKRSSELEARTYRSFVQDYPHFSAFLQDAVGTTLAYSEQWGQLGIYVAIAHLQANEDAIFPYYLSYGHDRSRALRQSREMLSLYPHFSNQFLTKIIGESLKLSDNFAVLPVFSSLLARYSLDPRSVMPTARENRHLESVRDYASIFSFMPGTPNQQAQKLAWINKINNRISKRNIRFLPKSERKVVEQWRHMLELEPITVDDLPTWTKALFKESGLEPLPPRPGSGVDYAFGNIMVVYQATSTFRGPQAKHLTNEMRSLRVDNKPLLMATNAFVFADMLDMVVSSGPQIALIALLLVFFIVLFSQRSFIAVWPIFLPLVAGMATTIGIMVWFDLKIGLFNMVILPVVMGIGIDGSIYLYERYRSLGRGSIFAALSQVGGAIFMSSATTLVGFGGMIFSMHMGLNTMGMLSIIGISTCFFATMLIEPGLILIAEKLKLRAIVPNHDYTIESPEETTTPSAS